MYLYPTLLWAAVQGQLVHRGSLLFEIAGRAWITGLEIIAVIALVDRAGDLLGFGRYEIVYLFGVSSVALGIAELLTDGVAEMPRLVRTGDLDAVLLRPVPTLVSVLAMRCRPLLLGRVIQGIVAVVLALGALSWRPGPWEISMLAVGVLASIGVYAGIFIAEGATAIFAVQSAEIFNAFSYGGQEVTRYPLSIYQPWLRSLFLWVVPVGFASYYPALEVLGREDILGMPRFMPLLSPFASLAFLLASVGYWSFAISRYRGAGG